MNELNGFVKRDCIVGAQKITITLNVDGNNALQTASAFQKEIDKLLDRVWVSGSDVGFR